MPYTPHTEEDIQRMLEQVGIAELDALFGEIPAAILYPDVEMAAPLCEQDLRLEAESLARCNRTTRDLVSFLGAGAYERIRPSAIDRITSRSEFITSYTPYQAEVSQGTLQFIYEFQSLVANLTGMEAANASMYDGASSMAEAALMALRMNHKSTILYAGTIHPRWKQTLLTCLSGMNVQLVEIPEENGLLNLDFLSSNLNENTAAVIVQNPNFFGYIEDMDQLAKAIRKVETVWILASDPMSLALLRSPGEWGADIAVGELQSLGMPLSFGGPYAGYFAVRNRDVRQMPGRLVGKTVDAEGKTGYVLTLQTREQHIRRDKATSNICTNQSLCALAATIYMSMLGPKGLQEASRQSFDKAHYLAERLLALPGVKALSPSPFYCEFTLALDQPAEKIAARLREDGFIPGLTHPRWTGDPQRMILCATEVRRQTEIDRFADAFAAALKG